MGEDFMRDRVFWHLGISLHKILINCKGQNGEYKRRILTDISVTGWLKLAVSLWEGLTWCMFWCGALEKQGTVSVEFLPIMNCLCLIMRKHQAFHAGDCYNLNVCVIPKLTIWSCNTQCNAVRRWDLWKVFKYEGGALMNGIAALWRRLQGDPWHLPACKDQVRRLWLWIQERAIAKTEPVWHLDFGPPNLQNYEK